MRLRNLYKSALLVLAGGMMLQTTGGCNNELMNSLVTSLAPVITSALTTVITGALTGALSGAST